MRVNSHQDTRSPRHQKKRIFLLVIFLFGIFVLLAGCARHKIINEDSKGTNIICFGDSITYGYGAEDDQNYPAFLAKITELPVINSGVDGESSTKALMRIETDVLNKDPLLVIIEFGGNDFLDKVPIETTISNIKKMIDAIYARGAMVALVDISAGVVLGDYRKIFLKIAQEKKTIFVPGLFRGIITNPALKSDFLHPNEKGYYLMARRVYQAISPYIKKRKGN